MSSCTTCFQSKTVAKSKYLFDSDDDSDDDDSDDDTNRFNIRQEFEGTEGRKVGHCYNNFSNFYMTVIDLDHY